MQNFNEELQRSNEKLLAQVQMQQNGVKEQVLIEDGTMAAFGFKNRSEVNVNDNSRR